MTTRPLTALSGLVLAFAAGATAAAPATVSLLTASNAGGVAAEHRTLPDQASDRAGQLPDAATSAGQPSPEATPSLPPCPADVKNHGAYVSSVAQSEEATGALVSAAAQSDCGKKAEETEETVESAESESNARTDHPTKDDHPTGDNHPTGKPSWAGRR